LSLRQHLLHDLDRRGDHNVTVASKPQSLGCGGGIVRDKLLLQKIRAPQGVNPLREPLLQLDFVSEVFRLARAKKVQTALDTSAQPFAPDNAEWMARFDRLLENTDLVILDLKEIDDEKHKKLTGHSNKNILAMAQYVAAGGVDLWVRHVLVPGLTDDADGLRQLDAFIKTLPTVRRVEILPYHTLGLFKWQNLGIPYPLDGVRVPTAEEVETAEQLLHVRDYPDAPKGSTAK